LINPPLVSIHRNSEVCGKRRKSVLSAGAEVMRASLLWRERTCGDYMKTMSGHERKHELQRLGSRQCTQLTENVVYRKAQRSATFANYQISTVEG
jgi:hypothetical protein